MLVVANRVILIILTVLYTVLSVVSCSTPPQPATLVLEDIPKAEPPSQTLTILQSQGDISQSLQQAAERYVELHPGISIRVQTIADEASYKATLRSRLVAGSDVGLFHIFGHRDMQEIREYLDDLSDIGWAKEAIADTIAPVTDGEGVYGIPYAVEAMGLIYNRNVFLAAQSAIASASTFEELEEAFKILREQMTLGVLAEDFPDLERVAELPAQDFGYLGRMVGDVLLTGEFPTYPQAFTTPSILLEREEATGKYIDLMARYSTHGRGWSTLLKVTRADQVEGGIATGRVAVVQQSTSIYRNVLARSEDVAMSLRLLPIPLDKAEQGYIYTQAPAYWAVGANASEQSKTIARDFLTWLYQSAEGAEILAESFWAVSPYREYAVETRSALDRQMLSYIDEGRSLPRYWREFPIGWDTGCAAGVLRRYLGEPDYLWEEAAQQLREDWTALRIG